MGRVEFIIVVGESGRWGLDHLSLSLEVSATNAVVVSQYWIVGGSEKIAVRR